MPKWRPAHGYNATPQNLLISTQPTTLAVLASRLPLHRLSLRARDARAALSRAALGKDITRLKQQAFLVARPSLLHHLRTDQAASHLGLGCLYRDQHLLDKAAEQLTQAHDLIQELILIEDSPDQQDRLGVTLTIHGEVLNRQAQQHTPGQSRISDSRAALEKQQKAVRARDARADLL